MQGLAPVAVKPAAQELQLPVVASHAPGLQPGWQLKQALAPSGAHFPIALQSAWHGRTQGTVAVPACGLRQQARPRAAR